MEEVNYLQHLRCPSSEQLAGCLDGTLDPPSRVLVLGHLNACDTCVELFAEAARALAPARGRAPARSRPQPTRGRRARMPRD